MLGCQPLHIDGGFLIYTIMTYKFYGKEGIAMEIIPDYETNGLILFVEGEHEQSTITLTDWDTDELIEVLDTFKKRQITL